MDGIAAVTRGFERLHAQGRHAPVEHFRVLLKEPGTNATVVAAVLADRLGIDAGEAAARLAAGAVEVRRGLTRSAATALRDELVALGAVALVEAMPAVSGGPDAVRAARIANDDRSSGKRAWRNAFAVWNALLLREALSRFLLGRGAWAWLLLEPVVHVSYLLVIYTVVRAHTIGGIDTTLWLLTGLLAFFLFRRTATQASNAIEANAALFTYRQVKPVDTVLVRSVLEAMVLLLVAVILFAGLGLMGHQIVPDRPLVILTALAALWTFGLGFGLVASVVTELVPEAGRVLKLAMMPLYLVSGVVFPLAAVPEPHRTWLLLNPIAHGVEGVRFGFSSLYHAAPGLSFEYLAGSALASVFVGLGLHRVFAHRLVTQ
jgi:capsular polysaccharide transport system permease protein